MPIKKDGNRKNKPNANKPKDSFPKTKSVTSQKINARPKTVNALATQGKKKKPKN